MAKLPDDPHERAKALGAVPLSEYGVIRGEYDIMSTGIFPVDYALGNIDKSGLFSGITQRDKIEVAAKNNSLKSAFTEQMMAATHKRYPDSIIVGVWSELPNKQRLDFMRSIGIKVENVMNFSMIDPDDEETKIRSSLGLPPKINLQKAEDALSAMMELCTEDYVKLSVIDSVGALATGLQLLDGKNDRDLNSSPVAALAKVFRNFSIQFNQRNNCSVLLMINQYKEQIKTDFFSKAPENPGTIQTPGGRDMEYFADVRILMTTMQKFDWKQKHSVEATPKFLGNDVLFDIFKNKYGQRRKITAFWDDKTKLFNDPERVIKIASFFGNRVKKEKNSVSTETVSPFEPGVASSGAYTYIGDNSLQGEAKLKEFLVQNPDIIEKLKPQLYPTHPNYFEDDNDYKSVKDINKALQ